MFNVGDFVQLRGRPARLAQLFVYKRRDERLLFLIADRLQLVYDEHGAVEVDEVLGLRVWRIARQVVVGIPGLDSQTLYFVQAPHGGGWMTGPDDGTEYFLECDWGVDYM